MCSILVDWKIIFSWYPSFPWNFRDSVCASTHSCGRKECRAFITPFLQLSWAGTGPCWNFTICLSSRRGLTLLLMKWKPWLKFWNIHSARSGSKTFKGVCSYFPQMFLCENIQRWVFQDKILISSLTQGIFWNLEGLNSEEWNPCMLQ